MHCCQRAYTQFKYTQNWEHKDQKACVFLFTQVYIFTFVTDISYKYLYYYFLDKNTVFESMFLNFSESKIYSD